MSGYRNALAVGPQVAPAPAANRLALQTPGVIPGNALAPPPGSGPGNVLKPRTSPAFPGDTRHMDPPAAPPMATPVDRSPAPPPAGAQMPGAAPGGVAGPAPHAADNVAQLRADLASAPIPAAKLAQVAGAVDHAIHLTGMLLQQPGPISEADLDAALKKASAGGKLDMQATAAFAAQLPPVSDQAALRSALMLQRQRSIQSLVALHGASQDRGSHLLPAQAPPHSAAAVSPQTQATGT